MLISLENTLGQLLDKMETLPADVVAQYEKKFEKDRRARLREEKVREQEMLQKERVRKALERAQAAPRTQVGRRPVKRKGFEFSMIYYFHTNRNQYCEILSSATILNFLAEFKMMS